MRTHPLTACATSHLRSSFLLWRSFACVTPPPASTLLLPLSSPVTHSRTGQVVGLLPNPGPLHGDRAASYQHLVHRVRRPLSLQPHLLKHLPPRSGCVCSGVCRGVCTGVYSSTAAPWPGPLPSTPTHTLAPSPTAPLPLRAHECMNACMHLQRLCELMNA